MRTCSARWLAACNVDSSRKINSTLCNICATLGKQHQPSRNGHWLSLPTLRSHGSLEVHADPLHPLCKNLGRLDPCGFRGCRFCSDKGNPKNTHIGIQILIRHMFVALRMLQGAQPSPRRRSSPPRRRYSPPRRRYDDRRRYDPPRRRYDDRRRYDPPRRRYLARQSGVQTPCQMTN